MAYLVEPEVEALPRDELASMQVEAIAGKGCVLSGARNAVQMVVRISTPKADETNSVRPPLHVACVMDCSGSMDGEKLAYAKKAVLKLVKHLSIHDTLHFVTYDTNVRTVFQNGDLSELGKERLRQQIEAVCANGKTNLCGGLDVAADLLEATASMPSPDSGALRRIFLFSDGRVNVGTTCPHEIRSKVSAWAAMGITTGTFGIGADFDEPLMRGIAAAGQGRYQFLATANDIPKLVSKSIHDLIDIFASDAVLDIRGYEHTTVTCVYGNHDEEDNGSRAQSAPGLLHLGDIHGDNLRAVLVELDVSPPGNALQGQAFVAVEWSLTCQRNGAPVQFSGQVQLRPTRERAALGDEAPIVQMAFALRRATDLEREVAERLSRRDRQGARDIKAQQMSLLQAALEAGERQQSQNEDVSRELELLTAVLERARLVSERLADDGADEELMARQCWQDRDDMSCASLCDLRQRSNSSSDGGDVADLQDFQNFSPRSSPSGSLCGSPLGSPRTTTPSTRSIAELTFGGRLRAMLPMPRMFRSQRAS